MRSKSLMQSQMVFLNALHWDSLKYRSYKLLQRSRRQENFLLSYVEYTPFLCNTRFSLQPRHWKMLGSV